MKIRVVLDTNVYVAAYLKKGLASKILLLGQSEDLLVYVSDQIRIEIQDTLLNKFKVDKKDIIEFDDLIQLCTNKVSSKQKLNVVAEDPEDNKILECAVEAKANLIVTMDKHLLKLKKYDGIGIVHAKTLTWILPKILK